MSASSTGIKINPLGTIAHKNSRFLQLWLDSYRFYRSGLWYYNGGEKPAELLKQHPELIHRVKGNFGADKGISQGLYKNRQHRWRQLDAGLPRS